MALLWSLRGLALGFALTCLMMAAIALTDRLPSEPMRANLLTSFENGSLQQEDWLEGDRRIGLNQYNDCLLVMMARFRPPSALSSSVAPVVAFNDYPSEFLDENGQVMTQCRIAYEAVQSDEPRALYEPERYWPYSRYVHAYRIPFHLLVSVVPVSTIRALYRWSGVILLAGIAAIHLARAIRATGPGRAESVAASLGFAVVAGAFLAFFGLDLFGTSLTHGPADLLLYGALAWLSLRMRDPTAGAWDIAAAVLGALAFAFDFLHGTLPLMMAIILGSAALRNLTVARPGGVAVAARLVGAFALGTAGAVAAKLLAIYGVEGATGLEAFLDQLRHRMGGEAPSAGDLLYSLYWSSYQIGWGSRTPALLALTAGTGGALLAAVALASGLLRPPWRGAALTALTSIGVIVVWYVLFRSHTTAHSTFMVRLLVWPIGMGLTCIIIVRGAMAALLRAPEP